MNDTEEMVTMGIRLRVCQRKSLGSIAQKNYNTPASLIRMAVDQLIAAVKANGGKIPETRFIANLTDNPAASAAADGGGGK